jgi:SAM-dependent methyltransferase
MTGMPAPSALAGEPAYVFGRDSMHAADHHRYLAEFLDPVTTATLAQTGVASGWHCLEVGAGGGSVARWLAGRVAPHGTVLATDISAVPIPPRPGLSFARHDIVSDPLPEASFDLIHARLVLLHLPERIAALHRMASALSPGGWLQLDEFDVTYWPALSAPDEAARDLYEKFITTKMSLMRSAGVDLLWARRLAMAIRDAGLVEIDIVPRLLPWSGGSAGARLQIHNTLHLRERFIEAGMDDAELARVRDVMTDPSFLSACVINSVRGRRPAS